MNELATIQERHAARVAAVKHKMMVEGSHLLCGHPYVTANRGSRVLAPIIARAKATACGLDQIDATLQTR